MLSNRIERMCLIWDDPWPLVTVLHVPSLSHKRKCRSHSPLFLAPDGTGDDLGWGEVFLLSTERFLMVFKHSTDDDFSLPRKLAPS